MQKYILKFFTNFYAKIKLCLVPDAFLMFVNKSRRYYCKCNVNRLSRFVLGLHSDPYCLWIADESDGWLRRGISLPVPVYYEIRSLTAAICHYCWIKEWVRGFVDGMSSSERSGWFRGWSFTIAATDQSHLTDGSLPAWWLSALPILTGIRIWLPVTSDPSTFRVRYYGCQYPTDESYQFQEDPSICQDLHQCLWWLALSSRTGEASFGVRMRRHFYMRRRA